MKYVARYCKHTFPRASLRKNVSPCGARIVLYRLVVWWKCVVAMMLAVCAAGCGGNRDNNGFQIGGSVTGLTAGSKVTLLNNGGDAATVSANGPFAFSARVALGARYNVTIGTQPSSQACIVNQGTGSGSANQDVTSVLISCDSWTETSAPVANVSAITISSDSIHLAVTEHGGGIITSNDGGFSWTRTSAPVAMWDGIASSADGTHLAAVQQTGPYSAGGAVQGHIYTSSDAGVTWTVTGAPANNWTSIASSTDGMHLVASTEHSDVTNAVIPQITYVGAVYISLNGGATWSMTSVHEPVSQVAISADGLLVAAAFPTIVGGVDVESFVKSEPGGVDTSPNGGITWTTTPLPAPPTECGTCGFSGFLALSANGSTLAVPSNAEPQRSGGGIILPAPVFGFIEISHDGGTTWAQSGAPTNHDWLSVASSADGMRLVAVATLPSSPGSEGSVYASSDGGTTWNVTSAPSTTSSVVSAADGRHLAAIVNGQTIWIGTAF